MTLEELEQLCREPPNKECCVCLECSAESKRLVLALLERLEKAEEALRVVCDVIVPYGEPGPDLHAEVKAMEAAKKALVELRKPLP